MDIFLLKYAQKFLARDGKKSLAVLDQSDVFAAKEDIMKIAGINLSENFSLIQGLKETKENFMKYDIVVVSMSFWESLKGKQGLWLRQMPSVLVINR